jgi:1-acyl-sn-glycerol-3-phosphate acyltransferase
MPLIRVLYVMHALVTFVILMLLIFPFVIIASFYGKVKGGNAVYRLCALWGDLWFIFIGIRHKNIHETPFQKGKNYIFIANHISYLDAPVIVKSIRQPVRALGKEEMSRIPIFGYIYKNAIVTIDRSNAERRAKSVRILKSVLKKGISIFIFPEGTFNETGRPLKDFYDGAFRIAIETQTPIKPILFLDAYSRMHYRSVFSITPGISRAVFLEEIPVEGLTTNDVRVLKEKVYGIMEERLIAYGAPWINDIKEEKSSQL